METTKKTLFFILLCLLCPIRLVAQDVAFYAPFQFSFIYPLGTNGMNAGQYTNGFSLNLLVGASKNEKSLAFAGLSNIILNDARGVQFAGFSNYIGHEGKGLAFAGLTNVTSDYRGVQFAGMLNVAKDIRGVQFAGLVNVAKEVRGVQFSGLVNVAKRVEGVQFATLVNVADKSDFPIGLVNIIKQGEKGIAVTYDLLGNTVVSFRSGGKYTYGILGIGFNHKVKGDDKMVSEVGYGIHIPVVNWFRIDQEVKLLSVNSAGEKTTLNVGYLLAPSFKIGRHFNLFGGPSLNYISTWNDNHAAMLPAHSLWSRERGERAERVYVGYQAGVQVLF